MRIQILRDVVINDHINQFATIMWVKICDSVRHAIDQQFMQARLIDDAVGKFRKARTSISDLFRAFDVLRVRRIGLPESVLLQMVGFFDHHFATVKGLHDLNRAARNTVSATKQKRPCCHVDNACFDIVELGHLASHC